MPLPLGQIADPLADINRNLRLMGIQPTGVQSARAARPTIEDYLSEFNTSEERASVLRQMSQIPLSMLSVVANVFQKPQRALYGLLGGNPREMLNVLPIPTDYLGITDPSEFVGGRGLLEGMGVLEKNTPGLDWGDVAGFGAEVLTDPLSYVTGGILPALSKSGKALKKSGLLDEFYRMAKYEPEALGLGKVGMGKRQALQHMTLERLLKKDAKGNFLTPLAEGPMEANRILKELGSLGGEGIGSTGAALRAPGQQITQQMRIALQKAGKSADEIAGMTPQKAQEFLQSQPGGIWDDVLGKTGGVDTKPRDPLRVQDLETRLNQALGPSGGEIADIAKEPLGSVARFMGTPLGTKGGMGEKVAVAMDNLGHSLRYSALPRYVAQKMSPAAGEMLSETGQVRSARTLQAVQEVEQAVLEHFAPVFSKFDDIGVFDADHIMRATSGLDEIGAKKLATDNARAVRRYAEGQFEILKKEVPGAKEGTTDFIWEQGDWSKGELPDNLKGLGIEDDIDAIRAMMGRTREMANKAGLEMDILDDMFIKYFPRALYKFPDEVMSTARKKAVGTFNPHALQRDINDIPGGTDVLIDMSVDGHISGLLRRVPSDPDNQRKAVDKIKLRLDTEYFNREEVVPASLREWYEGNKGQILNKLSRWVGNLDPRHAAEAVPAYKLNPLESVRDYMINTVRATTAAETATNLIVANAVAASSLPAAGSTTLRHVLNSWLIVNKDEAPSLISRKLHEVMSLDKAGSDMALQQGHMTPNTHAVLKDLWQKHGNDVANAVESGGKMPKDFELQILDNLVLPKELADDVGRYLRSYSDPADANDAIKGAQHWWDYYTNMWKGSVTSPWPAFGWRNYFSALMSNVYAGAGDPKQVGFMKYFMPQKQAHAMINGKTIKGIANDIPGFQGMTDAEATRRLSEEVWAGNLVGKYQTRAEFVGQAGMAEGVAENIPGMRPKDAAFPLVSPAWWQKLAPEKPTGPRTVKVREGATRVVDPLGVKATDDVFKTLPPEVPSIASQYLDVRNIRGVGGRTDSTWRPAAAGELSNEYIENLVRISGYLGFRKQGYTVAEALRKVKLAQVDYSALTGFERNVMRRIIPFYSFTRRQIPFVVEVMAERPGGALPQMIKGVGRIRRESTKDQLLPDDIAQSVAIPIGGEDPAGQQQFLTGLSPLLGGAEDVLGILRPGVDPLDTFQRGLAAAGGRLHPILQAIWEGGSGHSLYSGRPLREQTSPLGTAIANIQTQLGRVGEGPRGSMEPLEVDPVLDAILNRSPISRLISTARTVTDPRKPLWGEDATMQNWVTRLGPAVMGAKFAEIDVARSQNRAARKMLEEQLAGKRGMRSFEHLYAPLDVIEGMDPKTRLLYSVYHSLGQEAKRRAADRRKGL